MKRHVLAQVGAARLPEGLSRRSRSAPNRRAPAIHGESALQQDHQAELEDAMVRPTARTMHSYAMR